MNVPSTRPILRAIASAVRPLSPVTMRTRIPATRQRRDRVGDLRPRRIEHADEAEELEVLLDVVGGCFRVAREDAAGEGEDAEGVALHRGLGREGRRGSLVR